MVQLWFILSGTIVNAITVFLGSLIGLSISGKLPERYRSIVLNSLGLVTIALGVDAAVLKFSDTVARFMPEGEAGRTYGARVAMVMIGSLLVGVVLGTWLKLHERVEALGALIHARFSTGHASGAAGFAEGFLTASVIFCVGPLTMLGCLQNGAHGDPSYLYIKALLDGFCSMALASAMGWGVFASVLTVLVFQGGLSLVASVAADSLHPLATDLMTVVGGVVLLATALMILEIKKLPVANMLPGIFLPPLFIFLAECVCPGILLPAAS